MSAIEIPPSSLMRHMILEGFKVPVVFNGFIDDWEILSWSLDTWAEKVECQVLPFRSGVRKSTKVPQWEGLCEKVNLTMKEFVKLEKNDVKKEENAAGDSDCSRWMYFDYKYMNEWFSDQQNLLNAVTWKNFGFPERGGPESTIWIGNEGAHTPCHLDSYGCNLVAQVYGWKQWILFPPEKTPSLLPTRIPYEESSIYSSINFYSPDPAIANELQEAYVVTLKPGDVLFVPQHWWHYVENIDTAVSVNSWIPLPSDDENRLEEALVRFFISQVCKDLPEHKLNQLLNPNEGELVDLPLSIAVQQIEICVEQCQQNGACSKEVEVDVDSENDHGDVKKKPRLDEKSDLFVHGQTSVLNKLTQEEVFQNFKNVISAVPKYSVSEFRSLLMKKQKLFAAPSVEDAAAASSSSSFCVDDSRMQDILNAFCHPEVISLVKDKLLMRA